MFRLQCNGLLQICSADDDSSCMLLSNLLVYLSIIKVFCRC